MGILLAIGIILFPFWLFGLFVLSVVMSLASNWMMFKIPGRTLLYTLLTGLGEMLIIGILYGLFLKPWM
jgi:hypothetical protein